MEFAIYLEVFIPTEILAVLPALAAGKIWLGINKLGLANLMVFMEPLSLLVVYLFSKYNAIYFFMFVFDELDSSNSYPDKTIFRWFP